ncbi:hypothetical protein Pla110_43510 [Polystyrenella longa]|uniref:Uncharacterized protein n=1 Tax=Polystyrenella longa TaxID=2528007 RepID=A0A518CTN1_9PLAN|nr:hypothetical protein [Polystyrenella longa]QDU82591.1 hypothetical protein Pla110_43510 [Polystyrenella longa]
MPIIHKDDDPESYITLNPGLRITSNKLIEVWKNILFFGRSRCVCRTNIANVQINLYYSKYFRTPCGNFGEDDIGMNAVLLSQTLGIPRLDSNTVQLLRENNHLICFGQCEVDIDNRQLILQGSNLIYPFSSLDLGSDGILRAKLHGNAIAQIPDICIGRLISLIENLVDENN